MKEAKKTDTKMKNTRMKRARVKMKRRGKKVSMLIPGGTELARVSLAREEVQELRVRPINLDPYQAGIQLLLICRTQTGQGFTYNHPYQTGLHPTPHCIVFPRDPTMDLLRSRGNHPPDLTPHISTIHQNRTRSRHGPRPSPPPALGLNAFRRASTEQRGHAMLCLRHRFPSAKGVNRLSETQMDLVSTETQLFLPQNGARALRREANGAYITCRAIPASRAASTWSSR